LAISRERKEELVSQYVEQLRQSEGVLVTDYRGLTVADMEALRRTLRKNDVAFRVVKNRLFALALGQVGLPMPAEWMDGPIAVAFCHGDMPAAVKVFTEAARDSEFLALRGGMMEARILSAEQVKMLAHLPSREVLLAQVLGTIQAPAAQVTGVVASGIRQVLNVLQAYVDKLGGAAPEPQAA